MRIIILEDNNDRKHAMQAVVADRFPQYRIEFFVDVPSMISRLEATGLYDVALVSLDHDLDIIIESDGRRTDPGTGVDAATWFANQPAVAPVIVHTTNTFAGDRMVNLLVESGWRCNRIVPYGGDDWIRERWFPMARKLVVANAPIAGMSAFGVKIMKCQRYLRNPVDRVLVELIRAARYLIGGSDSADAISIQILHFNPRNQLAPLIPDDGILENSFFSFLKHEFEGLVIGTGPASVDDMTISGEFRNTLNRLKVRQMQIDVIRIAGEESMQAMMVIASFADSPLLDSHRTQSILVELRNLIELAIIVEMGTTPISAAVLPARKRAR